MSDFTIQLLAIIFGWAAVVLVAYFMVRWCFNENFSWKKVMTWVSYITAVLFAFALGYYFLPVSWQDFFGVIINHFICAAAVHALFLRSDDYLLHKHNKGIPKAKLYFGITFVYLLMALDTLVVIKLNSHVIAQIAQVAVTYLTRGAILMCLVLEIRLRGVPKPETIEEFMEDY